LDLPVLTVTLKMLQDISKLLQREADLASSAELSILVTLSRARVLFRFLY
jgi:hypothetical protein